MAELPLIPSTVVGSHGNAGHKRFHLGSVPSRLSHHAPTSVLIVRGG